MKPQGLGPRHKNMRNTDSGRPRDAGGRRHRDTAIGCASAPARTPAVEVSVARGVAAIEPAANPRPLGAADTAFGLTSCGPGARSTRSRTSCSRRDAGDRAGHGLPGRARGDRAGHGAGAAPARGRAGRARRAIAGQVARADRAGRAGRHAGGEQPGVGGPGADAAARLPERGGDRLWRRGGQGTVQHQPAARRERDQPGDLAGHSRTHHRGS